MSFRSTMQPSFTTSLRFNCHLQQTKVLSTKSHPRSTSFTHGFLAFVTQHITEVEDDAQGIYEAVLQLVLTEYEGSFFAEQINSCGRLSIIQHPDQEAGCAQILS